MFNTAAQKIIAQNDTIEVILNGLQLKYNVLYEDSNGIEGVFYSLDSSLKQIVSVVDNSVIIRWKLDKNIGHYSIRDFKANWEENYKLYNDSSFKFYSRVKYFSDKGPIATFMDKKGKDGLPEYCLISKNEEFKEKGAKMNLVDTVVNLKFIYYEDKSLRFEKYTVFLGEEILERGAKSFDKGQVFLQSDKVCFRQSKVYEKKDWSTWRSISYLPIHESDSSLVKSNNR